MTRVVGTAALARLAAALCAAVLLLCASVAAFAQDLLPVPPLSVQVIDQTATLDETQRGALIAKLAAIEQQTGSQIVVLMVPSTLPEDIATYSQRVGDAWKIGRREIGDGLLIVVAKNDRRVRIEVVKTLEGAIPDLAAKRIIDAQITPAFRAGDYAGGLNRAVDQLAARIRGEALPEPQRPDARGSGGGNGGFDFGALAIFFFVAVPMAGTLLTRLMGRKLGALATGGVAGGLSWWLTTSLLMAGAAGVVALVLVGIFGIGAARRGGSGGLGGIIPPVIWGGGGGGGFGSGGGGDFGGGGASGGW